LWLVASYRRYIIRGRFTKPTCQWLILGALGTSYGALKKEEMQMAS